MNHQFLEQEIKFYFDSEIKIICETLEATKSEEAKHNSSASIHSIMSGQKFRDDVGPR
jgi:hypothetical protein